MPARLGGSGAAVLQRVRGDDCFNACVEGFLIFRWRRAWQPAERRAGQDFALVADLQGAIEEVMQGDARAAHGDARAGGPDAILRSLRAERQRLRQHALFLSRQRFIERLWRLRPGPVCRGWIAWLDGEPGVPYLHEPRYKSLRIFNARYAPKPHLLDQTVLQGLVGPLDPALGLRRQRVDEFDLQTLHDAAKLGLAVAALRVLRVDAENPVPVAVEGQRAAVRQNMTFQRAKIGARRL